MDPNALKEKLMSILVQIQVDSGLDCPDMTGATKPAESLPKFDSKVWPAATTILATDIGATIPNDVNLFFDEATKLARSIDETVSMVCGLLKQSEQEVAA